jgi:hypothetical protein
LEPYLPPFLLQTLTLEKEKNIVSTKTNVYQIPVSASWPRFL